jgi:Flp pilus assembly pilin Flp
MNPLYRITVRQTTVDEKGQTMAEYGIVLSVICVATVTVFAALSDGVTAAVDRAVDLIPG